MRCPLCDGPDNSTIMRDGKPVLQTNFGVAFLECADCGFVFTDFIYQQVLDYYYTHFCRLELNADDKAHLQVQATENAQSQLDTIRPYLPENFGKVLDFGGGSGEAARLYLPYSDEVYITESDPRSIERIREGRELKLIEDDHLMDDEFVGFFDLVIFSNVLEHMTYPIKRMGDFSRIIKPGGWLFVEIPNEAEPLKQTGWHSPQHILFFSPKTFEDLVHRQGSFDIEDLRTCGAPLKEIIAAKGLIHAFDKLQTPDGWVIRSLLKNSRPQPEIKEVHLNPDDARKTLADLSDYAFRMVNNHWS